MRGRRLKTQSQPVPCTGWHEVVSLLLFMLPIATPESPGRPGRIGRRDVSAYPRNGVLDHMDNHRQDSRVRCTKR